MTAQAHEPRRLPPARTPAAIRAALRAADRGGFERQFQAALEQAASDYDLAPVHDVVDQWWHVAVLTADPAAHQRTLDRAEALRTGQAQPGTPWNVVRAGLGV
jgi:hypothetical protein